MHAHWQQLLLASLFLYRFISTEAGFAVWSRKIFSSPTSAVQNIRSSRRHSRGKMLTEDATDTKTRSKQQTKADCFDDPLDSKSGNRNEIVVSADIELPFSKDVAFDAFSDLSRQPSWSPWLKSVTYLDDQNHNDATNTKSRWTVRWFGLNFSWDSIQTQTVRPQRTAWRSTEDSFMKNKGCVDFVSNGENKTFMQLTMSFILPPLMSKLIGFRGPQKIKDMVEDRMLKTTLENFREVVLKQDLKMSEEQAKAALQAVEKKQ